MDCLDRTNVVQSVISRNIAHKQLWKMNIAGEPKGDPFEKFSAGLLEEAFREAWTDNADRISILYTGTPALKTDFTRTGKRTWKGALNDGKNAV
jgi:phosphatidylinositol 4-phosphatase